MAFLLKVAITVSISGSLSMIAASPKCMLTSYYQPRSQTSSSKSSYNSCITPTTCNSPHGCLDLTGTSAGLGLIACNGLHYPLNGTSTSYAVSCDCASLDAEDATNCAGATPALSYSTLPYCAQSRSYGGCGLNYCNPVRTETYCARYISPQEQYMPAGFKCSSPFGCIRSDNNYTGNEFLVCDGSRYDTGSDVYAQEYFRCNCSSDTVFPGVTASGCQGYLPLAESSSTTGTLENNSTSESTQPNAADRHLRRHLPYSLLALAMHLWSYF